MHKMFLVVLTLVAVWELHVDIKSSPNDIGCRLCKFFQETENNAIFRVLASKFDHLRMVPVKWLDVMDLVFSRTAIDCRGCVNEDIRWASHRPNAISALLRVSR